MAQMDSVRSLIHKKKEAKKNTEGHMANDHMDSRPYEGSTKDTRVNSTKDTKGKRNQATTPRYVQQRKHVEIDQYLFNLITDGLINPQYKAWHAKCIYTLGWERYNAVVLDVRESILRGKEGSGRVVDQPAALLGYKMKGLMQLHAREKYYREP